MEALYSPRGIGFALPQWNNASCEKPLILGLTLVLYHYMI